MRQAAVTAVDLTTAIFTLYILRPAMQYYIMGSK